MRSGTHVYFHTKQLDPSRINEPCHVGAWSLGTDVHDPLLSCAAERTHQSAVASRDTVNTGADLDLPKDDTTNPTTSVLALSIGTVPLTQYSAQLPPLMAAAVGASALASLATGARASSWCSLVHLYSASKHPSGAYDDLGHSRM